MKELRFTKQFKKDIKRYLHQPKKLKELNDILDKAKEGRTVAERVPRA